VRSKLSRNICAHLDEEVRDVLVVGVGRVRGVGGVEEACQALHQSGTLNCRITHGEHTMNRRAASAVYLCARRGRGPRSVSPLVPPTAAADTGPPRFYSRTACPAPAH
jgi:hypothetical protein